MKFLQKQRSKKICKELARDSYEMIDLTLQSPRGILNIAGSCIVGSSIQSQKVSSMIIMVSMDAYTDPNSTIKKDDLVYKFGLMFWEYDDRDVVYVAGSLSDFYNMCVYYITNKKADAFVNFVIHRLLEADYKCNDIYNTPLFNDIQIAYLDTTLGDIHSIDKNRMVDMMSFIPPSDLECYRLTPIVIPSSNHNKGVIMSMAKFSFVGQDNVIAYATQATKSLIKSVFPEIETKIYKKDEDSDMIAMEVIE